MGLIVSIINKLIRLQMTKLLKGSYLSLSFLDFFLHAATNGQDNKDENFMQMSFNEKGSDTGRAAASAAGDPSPDPQIWGP